MDEGAYRPHRTRRANRAGKKRVTVVYGGTLAKDPKAPYMKNGDDASRKAFRESYLKYRCPAQVPVFIRLTALIFLAILCSPGVFLHEARLHEFHTMNGRPRWG